jgi:hypothetical protein
VYLCKLRNRRRREDLLAPVGRIRSGENCNNLEGALKKCVECGNRSFWGASENYLHNTNLTKNNI